MDADIDNDHQCLAAWLGGSGCPEWGDKKEILKETVVFFLRKPYKKLCQGFDVILIFVQRFFVQKKRVILVRRGKGGASEESGARQQKGGQTNQNNCIDNSKERCPSGNTMPAEAGSGRRFPR